MKFDENGLIVVRTWQGELDGGDTLLWQGMWWYLGGMKNDQVRFWVPDPWIRNPIKWNDPKDVSRDQLVPWYLMGRETKWFAPNWDFCGFLKLLANRDSLLRYVGDLGPFITCFNRIGWMPRWKHETLRFVTLTHDDVDDNNFCLELLHALKKNPTFLTRITLWLYRKFRPTNYGALLGEYEPIMQAWAWYHRFEAGGNPEFVELFRPYYEKYFKGVSNESSKNVRP